MLWTIQWYIFRELGKAFLLTAVGITAVLGMGGGVLNMIGLQNVGAGQLLRILAVILPVAASLALPVAALFSAAVVYGRLSADNEFVACRASGVNIHWLFLPTVVISLVSAVLTFVSINYLIPNRIRNLDELIQADLTQIVLRALQQPQRLKLGGDRFRFYAQDPREITDPELPADSKELLLRGVAFAELDQDNWARYGTAESARIRFDNLESEPSVRVDLYGLSLFDRKGGRWGTYEHEPLRRGSVPRRMPFKVKWLTLTELFHYRGRAEELPKIHADLGKLRAALTRERFYRSLEQDFADPDAGGQPDCELAFGDRRITYHLQAESMTPDLHDRKPSFENVRVVQTVGGREKSVATAGGATIGVSLRDGSPLARLQLFNGVTMTEADDPANPVRKERETLEAVALPEAVLAEVASISDRRLLDPQTGIDAGRGFGTKRAKVIEKYAKGGREIAGVIHSRLAFSVSTFVLVLLGAALGIVFRGAHVLTAFGISFLPSLFVIVTIIMGRQLAQNADTVLMGIATIWGGIVLVGGMDLWTLTRLVQR